MAWQRYHEEEGSEKKKFRVHSFCHYCCSMHVFIHIVVYSRRFSYDSRMFQEISRMIRVELARRRMLRQIKEEHYETTNIRQDGDASTLLL